MVGALLAYALALVFFGLELLLRRGPGIRSPSRGELQRGNSLLIGVSYVLGLFLAPMLNMLLVGKISPAIASRAVGLGLMVLGLALRVWSMTTLGAFYTRALMVSEGQTVVQDGPYRWIRHPGYLGSVLVWIGLPLSLANWIAAMAVVLLMGVAYGRRIRTEEAMLLREFGADYLQYKRRTWRLIPFLF